MRSSRSSRSAQSLHSDASKQKPQMTHHESVRAKKLAEMEMRAVENRIKYFKREEEKIWKDLEDVRRQAKKIEEGRGRASERRFADQWLNESKRRTAEENRRKARQDKEESDMVRKKSTGELLRAKREAGEARKREMTENSQQKRMLDAQERLRNSERAVAIQRAQLEAKLRNSREQADKISKVRQEHEELRRAGEEEVMMVENRMPELEREEQLWLQRLQNSRIVTQSVLEELETSMGSAPLTALLKSKSASRVEAFPTQRSPSPEAGASPSDIKLEERLDAQERAA